MYRFHPNNGVILISTGEHIPAIKSDQRWRDYQAWVKAGNVAEPAETYAEPLELVYSRLISKINQRRNHVEQTYFMYLGKPLDSNPVSAIRITAAASAAQTALAIGLPFDPIDWTCYDNTILTMTAQQVIGMPLALAAHSQSCHAVATQKKAQAATLYEAEDRAGLESFDINSGWPAG